MNTVGILAFGSLMTDPGEEIASKLAFRIRTVTHFPAEYARLSRKTRGGAPTLVPHKSGGPVKAEILVLDNSVTIAEARDILWRRERNKVGSSLKYSKSKSDDSVLVRTHKKHSDVRNIHYTDFNPDGKLKKPIAAELAKHAILSVKKAKRGRDGITYLMNAIGAGIKTPLTEDYVAEILRLTETQTLPDAIEAAKAM